MYLTIVTFLGFFNSEFLIKYLVHIKKLIFKKLVIYFHRRQYLNVLGSYLYLENIVISYLGRSIWYY